MAFLVGAWLVSVPAARVFAFTLDLGLAGLWYGLCVGYSVVTIIASWGVARSDWEAIKVRRGQRLLGNLGEFVHRGFAIWSDKPRAARCAIPTAVCMCVCVCASDGGGRAECVRWSL